MKAPPPPPGILPLFTILVAAGCVVGAWLAPVGYKREVLIFTSSASLLDILRGLVSSGEFMVAAVVGIFASVFPLAKLLVLLTAWGLMLLGLRPPEALFSMLEAVGRWSMLDVFVAALIVAVIKLQAYPAVDMSVGPAIVMLLAACLLTALSTFLVKRSAKRPQPQQISAERKAPTF